MEIQTSIHTISICVVPKQNGAHEEGVGLQGSTGTLVGDAYVAEETPAGGAIPIGTANRGMSTRSIRRQGLLSLLLMRLQGLSYMLFIKLDT